MKKRWAGRTLLVAIGALATLVACLAYLNVTPAQRGLAQLVQDVSPVQSTQFKRETNALLGFPQTQGNSVSDYQDGDAYFPAILADIRAAKSSIDLETYIFRDGAIAQRFVAALSERAHAGVSVHVLADRLGSRGSNRLSAALRAAGVHFQYFRPVTWPNFDRINNRTHRKLLIVDGRVGWTGGFGIDDAWLGDARGPHQKRDMMFRVEGPVVAQMQSIFLENWKHTTGEVLAGAAYFPELDSSGHTVAQMQASAPKGGRQDGELMFLLAIEGAQTSIDMEASYFIPDKLMKHALLAARKRGVRIRVIMPGPYVDGPVTGDASQAGWGDYLEAGVQMYTFQASLFHAKLLVVDDYLTVAGSSNFDYRSFDLNDEADLIVYDSPFANRMTSVFERDLTKCDQVSLAQWHRRSWKLKTADWFWGLMATQL
ncbi:MAG TPA: phospholipase D-like domain-containing protein [Rhodanobacter sp.]|jgi:cardiolipin synthase|nr:phospholipase D-like domain-containing protein [Rhodanobacter sp.]